MSDSSDSELVQVREIRQGGEAAFETLFREYYAPLCDFVSRILPTADQAEEVVQNLFLVLWRDRASWKVQSSLKAYLFRAARNRALNELRSTDAVRRLAEGVGRQYEVEGTSAPALEDRLEAEARALRVRRAIARLPERCRMAVRLRWLDQLSYSEIAEVMGISRKGVENQLSRGLKALRAELSDATALATEEAADGLGGVG